MSKPHKPTGYPTVSPYLIVDGAARTIDFLVRALGGTPGGTTWWIATPMA